MKQAVTITVYYILHIYLTSELMGFIILSTNLSLEDRLIYSFNLPFSKTFSFNSSATCKSVHEEKCLY